MLSQNGRAVQKVVGSTLETVFSSESLPADMQFNACRIFVAKEEVIYLLDNLTENGCILRINPAESLQPVVVAEIPTKPSDLTDLFVSDAGTIYVADWDRGKVLAFHPSSPTFMEVLTCPDGSQPTALWLQDRSLYVSVSAPTMHGEPITGRVYEYVLPPELQLRE